MKKLVCALKQKPCAHLKNWLILAPLAALSLGATTCQKNPDAPDLSFKGEAYATDAGSASIVRILSTGELDIIPASDTRFNDRVCFTTKEYSDHLADLAELSWLCEKWRKQ